MISAHGKKYSGWQEYFIRACLAMAREGLHSRELKPRGTITTSGKCPICKSDCCFLGYDLECGKFYETASASFCCNCGNFEVQTTDANYSTYNPLKVLQVMKYKVSLSPEQYSSSDKPTKCPVCGAPTYTFHKDLGGIDYYDNYWTVCINPFCDWPGQHREEFEWGPYTTTGGPTVWKSDIRRFQTVFISYNTQDQKFADKIYNSLKLYGVPCWYAPHHIRGGRTVREQIQSAIQKHERVLLIISEASMNSEWVHYEISEAKRREKEEGRRVLFPISLVPFEKIKNWVIEDDQTPDLAKEIRKFYIPDFSRWQNREVFGSEFKKLLDALAKQQAV